VTRSKNEWQYTTTPPIRLHGVVLSERKSVGTTLLLPFTIFIRPLVHFTCHRTQHCDKRSWDGALLG